MCLASVGLNLTASYTKGSESFDINLELMGLCQKWVTIKCSVIRVYGVTGEALYVAQVSDVQIWKQPTRCTI